MCPAIALYSCIKAELQCLAVAPAAGQHHVSIGAASFLSETVPLPRLQAGPICLLTINRMQPRPALCIPVLL